MRAQDLITAVVVVGALLVGATVAHAEPLKYKRATGKESAKARANEMKILQICIDFLDLDPSGSLWTETTNSLRALRPRSAR